ncbi:MAG: hypothetical protein H0X17_21880 [Deltaproteobacteria bacterium]|nr:hypothetical protein [Deltaproteobacteria bacterium]
MKPEVLLELLENAADQLGIRVTYEPLQSSVVNGGLCRVKGEYRIIVDKRTTVEERVVTVATAINTAVAAHGGTPRLDELELPQKVRDVLRTYDATTKSGRIRAA